MFNNIYKDKKVLITGDSGFKGSWLTIWLLKLGAKVIGLSLDPPSNPSMFHELDLLSKISHNKFDIRDFNLVQQLINDESPDFIFHLAAQSLVSESYKDPLTTISTNIVGVANTLESARNLQNDCAIIIITSDKCYDNLEWEWGYRENDKLGGKDIYSSSKASAELIFNSYYHSFFENNKYNLRIASARAGNVIGGGDWAKNRLIPDCMRAWNSNKIVEIRNPQSTRPWQHVLEPLSGYLTLGEKLKENKNMNGHSFNFGPSPMNNHSVLDLISDLSKHWKFENNSSTFRIIESSVFDEARLLKLNCDKSLFFFKWRPTLDYSNLIEFTGSWYAHFYNGHKNIYEFSLNQIEQYEKIAAREGIDWAM